MSVALPAQPRPTGSNPGLLLAYAGERPERLPVWFMRQAGRSLPEYRAARAGTDMLSACCTPELVAEITAQPVRRHGVDAGIFFSDIVTPLYCSGVEVEIAAGIGPVFADPVRDTAALERLVAHAPGGLDVITRAARLAADELDVPLIGFAGAPFTLAAYAVEGRSTRDHLAARTLMHSEPALWDRLMTWMADQSGAFLAAQVDGGARAVQLFDSWAGSLSVADYTRFAAPYSARAISWVAGRVPVVAFGTGTSEFLPQLRAAGADVVGVDHRIGLDEASRRLGDTTPVQGNIDPAFLAAPWPALERHVRDVIERGRRAPAHVVNLGHGVPPQTDPGVLTALVELVHSL